MICAEIALIRGCKTPSPPIYRGGVYFTAITKTPFQSFSGGEIL